MHMVPGGVFLLGYAAYSLNVLCITAGVTCRKTVIRDISGYYASCACYAAVADS